MSSKLLLSTAEGLVGGSKLPVSWHQGYEKSGVSFLIDGHQAQELGKNMYSNVDSDF